jgi:hypothetical protein
MVTGRTMIMTLKTKNGTDGSTASDRGRRAYPPLVPGTAHAQQEAAQKVNRENQQNMRWEPDENGRCPIDGLPAGNCGHLPGLGDEDLPAGGSAGYSAQEVTAPGVTGA